MDAAKSGLNQHINLTPEMANEIKVGSLLNLFFFKIVFLININGCAASGKSNKEKDGNRKPFIREKTD